MKQQQASVNLEGITNLSIWRRTPEALLKLPEFLVLDISVERSQVATRTDLKLRF